MHRFQSCNSQPGRLSEDGIEDNELSILGIDFSISIHRVLRKNIVLWRDELLT